MLQQVAKEDEHVEQTQIWYISICASLTSAFFTETCSGVHPAQCISYCSVLISTAACLCQPLGQGSTRSAAALYESSELSGS